MLRGLSATGFEGMFTVSYEPFNQEVRFSIASESPEEYRAMISRLKANILASHPRAEFEFLEATPENVLWPIGGLPVSKQKNTLIVSRGGRISAVSFLSMRLDDNLLASLEDGLENAIRTSAESGCTFRFCVPIKSCRGFLHAIALWAKRREISLRYSRVYGELREKGLSHNKGFLVGSDLEKSSELRTLLSQHERARARLGLL